LIDLQAVAVAHSEVIENCTITESGCLDASSSSYGVWKKRAFAPKVGDDDLGDLGDGDGAGATGGGSTAGIGGTPAGGATAKTGGTAQIGGVGGDDTSTTTAADEDGDQTVTTEAPVDAGPPSDAGSGDSAASVGSQSTSDEDFPQGLPNQPAVDITAKGYVQDYLYGALTDAHKQLIVITKQGVTGNLDEIEVDTEADSLGVLWAVNAYEQAGPTKLPLRTIAVSVWQTYSEKSIGDLKSINYQRVVNADMKAGFAQAYSDLGKVFIPDDRVPVTLVPGTDAFNTMMGTPFGNGAAKMLVETAGLSGRSITSIDLFPNQVVDVQFNF
jgi:hypothetical protein